VGLEGPHPTDGPTVVVETVSARRGEVTESRTPILVTVTARNPGPVPALVGDLAMDHIETTRNERKPTPSGVGVIRNAGEDAEQERLQGVDVLPRP